MNRRGDFSVLLLVFMVFVIIGIALFTFLQYRGLSGRNIIDVGYVYQNYFREDYAKYYLISTSKEILKDRGINSEGFKTQLKTRIASIDDSVLEGVKEKLASNDFSVVLDANKLSFEMKRVLFSIERKTVQEQENWFKQFWKGAGERIGFEDKDITGRAVVNYWKDIRFEILR